jgi:hypothetical protein
LPILFSLSISLLSFLFIFLILSLKIISRLVKVEICGTYKCSVQIMACIKKLLIITVLSYQQSKQRILVDGFILWSVIQFLDEISLSNTSRYLDFNFPVEVFIFSKLEGKFNVMNLSI